MSSPELFDEIGDDSPTVPPAATTPPDVQPAPKRARKRTAAKAPAPEVEIDSTAPPTATAAEVDWFSDEQVRIDPTRDVMAEKQLRIVPARKPKKTEWVRVHPDPVAYVRDTIVIKPDDQSGGNSDELYFVPGDVRAALDDGDYISVRLHLAVNRHGDPFLWWVRVYDDAGGPGASWSQSALDAVGDARKTWVRVVANKRQGGYDVFHLKDGVNLPEPKWPDKPMGDLLKLAFRDRIITSDDHVLLKQLHGRA